MNKALIQAIQNRDVVAAGKILPQLNPIGLVEQHEYIQEALSKNDAAMLQLFFENNFRLSYAMEKDIFEKSIGLCSLDVVKIITAQMSIHVNETTGLHIAAERGDINIIKFLLEIGADLNREDSRNSTPLEYAMLYSKNLLTVKFLIDKGANINRYSKVFKEPMSDAVQTYLSINESDTFQLVNRITKLEAEVTMLKERLARVEKQSQEPPQTKSTNRATMFR